MAAPTDSTPTAGQLAYELDEHIDNLAKTWRLLLEHIDADNDVITSAVNGGGAQDGAPGWTRAIADQFQERLNWFTMYVWSMADRMTGGELHDRFVESFGRFNRDERAPSDVGPDAETPAERLEAAAGAEALADEWKRRGVELTLGELLDQRNAEDD